MLEQGKLVPRQTGAGKWKKVMRLFSFSAQKHVLFVSLGENKE